MPRGVKRKDPAGRPAVDRGIPVEVVDVLLEILPIDEDEITMDTKVVEDLGADSLDVVELAMRFEEVFALPPIDEDMEERWHTATVGAIVDDVRRLGARV